MSPSTAQAARLREEFDRTFTLPPPEATHARRDFVLVQIETGSGDGQIVALPAEQLRGIERGPAVIPVPSQVLALEGIAGLHGAIVPVFRLPGAAARMSVAWRLAPLFALVETPASEGGGLAGFAFDRLEGFVRVAPETVHAESGDRGRETLEYQNGFYPVLRPAELLRGNGPA